ncbi:hypothetical protein [Microcoleus asticus]|uniref:Uncharacterized protein n=1 Tax=Microcoleus asticus IPMA8 TaxID=2563858 RepID=A0ABX2CR49_9CYAN|nr:hypothetical protein [Microcoleus asticus]NQE32839.1 hypothetical protein [Microcoleus asticus IPMA8]
MLRHELTSQIIIDNEAMEDTAVPFPYPKIIDRARSDITIDNTAVEDTAMPFPYPKIIY